MEGGSGGGGGRGRRSGQLSPKEEWGEERKGKKARLTAPATRTPDTQPYKHTSAKEIRLITLSHTLYNNMYACCGGLRLFLESVTYSTAEPV